MKNINNFWDASIEEMAGGYCFNGNKQDYVCLVCNKAFTKGIIYKQADTLLEAELAVREHVKTEHTSMFDVLINMDKQYTGLTEHQRRLLIYFFKGLSDKEISEQFDEMSISTVRNHRFNLKEKQKQAKVFIALMQLIETTMHKEERFIDIPRTAQQVDERFAITEVEFQKVLKQYFPEGEDGPLKEFPVKAKRKTAILAHLIKRFDPARRYTEKEVNEILRLAYHDYVTLRRYLIDYGFLDRVRDGSAYWVKT
jgi:hypothetical protein